MSRIAYHAINGTGLGHVTRLCNVAAAVRERNPEAHQLFVTNASEPMPLIRAQIPFVQMPGSDRSTVGVTDRRRSTLSNRLGIVLMCRVFEEYDPDVIVFDTHYPLRTLSRLAQHSRAALVLILRACRVDYLRMQLERGDLACFDRVLVAESPETFLSALPDDVRDSLASLNRVRCVGPVGNAAVAHPYPDAQGAVIITCGAGGYHTSARMFLERAARAACAATEAEESPVWVVRGAYGPEVDVPSRCRVVGVVPELARWFSGARLVIGHAGYNTVNEVLAAGAPLVLVPLPRLSESQAARARALETQGRAEVVAPDDDQAALEAACRRAVAAGRHRERLMAGGPLIAEELLALAPPVPRIVWSETAPIVGPARRATPGELVGAGAVLLDAAQCAALPDVVPRATRFEVYLGDACEQELLVGAKCALGELSRRGVAAERISLFLCEAPNQDRLVAVASAFTELRLRDVVALLPDALARDEAGIRERYERCRRLKLPFRVDQTPHAAPLYGGPER